MSTRRYVLPRALAVAGAVVLFAGTGAVAAQSTDDPPTDQLSGGPVPGELSPLSVEGPTGDVGGSPDGTDPGVETPRDPGVAHDADGVTYPEGGPSGLYQAIVDKQQKLEANPDNPGLQNALNRLRRNLERSLARRGIDIEPAAGDGAGDTMDIAGTVPEDTPPEGGADTPTDTPPDPSVAHDAEGNPYPTGGPSGLYQAIVDKQQKLESDPTNPGLTNALNRLRRNLERSLAVRGIDMEPPAAGDDAGDTMNVAEAGPDDTLPEGGSDTPTDSLPDPSVAHDAEGNPYPTGGPSGLYQAIVDKQQKLESDPTNPGLSNALNKLRRNLERSLAKRGIEMEPLTAEEGGNTEGADTGGGDVAALAEGSGDGGDTAGAGDAPADTPPDPNVAHDADGNPYASGGPKGLYNAIVDKQQKVEAPVEGPDGTLTTAETDGGKGLKNALGRLRRNLERFLAKRGLTGDDAGPDGVGDATTDPGTGEVTTASDTGTTELASRTRGNSWRSGGGGALPKANRPHRPIKPEKVVRPERPVKPERPDKPQKVERPQRPDKVARVERPQRPDKPDRPNKPEKPEKPDKPERRGR